MSTKTGRTGPKAEDYLRHLVEVSGSDLHLKAGGPAYVRVDGELTAVATLPPLTPADTEGFARQLMPADRWERFQGGVEADFAYSLPDGTRFRAAAFSQLGRVGLVLRRVESGGPSFDDLGLPASVRKLAEAHLGLVLVAGPTGSGKTTTTAAMIGHINATRRCHIVTIEDPIEIIHGDHLALVDQREIGTDTGSFASALRSAARQDPDVIFVGEMRDL
ncbi:MAG TPA: ATPase, T2SS/T4P/T4SS family, partial [Acidimicrobiales bacterium]|nr:ATPase, T2SS/T4P/T4SS family [Acidimicrobiales bacterium]